MVDKSTGTGPGRRPGTQPGTIIVTFIADDRPGLVGRLSDTVAAAGGNWLESRLAHLAEKFTGIARIGLPAGEADKTALKKALRALEAEGFVLQVEDARAPGTGPRADPGETYEIDLLGPDQPGIVREVSNKLAALGVTVEEMATGVRDAPVAGGTLFEARLVVRPADPSGTTREPDLREALEDLAEALMVDILLREGSEGEA